MSGAVSGHSRKRSSRYVLQLTRASFYVVLFLSFVCALSLGFSSEVVSTGASD